MSTDAISLCTLFFPPGAPTPDRDLLNTCQLLLKVATEAKKALDRQDPTAFDALVGDFGCESRAIILYRLFTEGSVQNELAALAKRIEEVRNKLTGLKSKPHLQAQIATFFTQDFASLTVSPNLGYLLQCYLLTASKLLFFDKDGIEKERTDISRLEKLTSGGGNLRKGVVNQTQSLLSLCSTRRIEEEAAKITTLPPVTSERIRQMLSPSKVKVQQKDAFPPKYIPCTFFNFFAILTRLKEVQATVVLKQQPIKGKAPFFLHYRSPTPGAPFARITPSGLPHPFVIALEGNPQEGTPLEELAKQIDQIGLEEILLANAALVDPLDEIDEPVAKKLAQLFQLDHVYCDRLEKGDRR